MLGAGTILYVSPGAVSDGRLALESLGHQVIVCEGPGDSGRCPLVEDGSCAHVDAADGVVFRLDLDDAYHRQMLRCYREEFGRTGPMHVVVSAGQEQRHAALLEGLPVSIGEIGACLGMLSAQVAMASAARLVLSELAGVAELPAQIPIPWSE